MHELPLLMALRVQGISTAERAGIAAGCPADVAAEALASFAARELCEARGGGGFALTPAGAAELDALLEAEGLCGSEALHRCYERFLGLNERVLKVSSDWQLRRDGGVEVPNDHSDASYDEEVIERLGELHDRARLCLGAIAGCGGRFAPYGARLDSCVERLRAGDRAAFTAPLAESYHTVWFELHQDLLLTLGLEREG
jgi:hypothetical protein